MKTKLNSEEKARRQSWRTEQYDRNLREQEAKKNPRRATDSQENSRKGVV